jgi:hypothetical protein
MAKVVLILVFWMSPTLACFAGNEPPTSSGAEQKHDVVAATPGPPPETPLADSARASPATRSEDSYGLTVPAGYELQALDVTDGRIAMPKDWFYATRAVPGGFVWTFSAEDPAKGEFKTGLTIQLFMGVEEKTKRSRETFARVFINEKHKAVKVVRDCPVKDFGYFRRQCIEVVEDLQEPSGLRRFHILYSVMWFKDMDLVALTTFGTPEGNWDAAAPIADVMSAFVLIGKNAGHSN